MLETLGNELTGGLGLAREETAFILPYEEDLSPNCLTEDRECAKCKTDPSWERTISGVVPVCCS